MDKLINDGMGFLGNQSQGQETHDDGLQNAHQEASRLAGSSGRSDLFSRVVGAIGQRKGQIANEDIDEEDAARKHKQAYQDDSHVDENSLGAAAAMQALKMFGQGGSGGGGGGSGGNGSDKKGGQGEQGTFLAMAMSEASKLFDDKAAQGKVPEGASKESTVQKAGEMAMKMYFKNRAKQQGGLMSVAAKYF